jgi:hypothetical protein
MHGVNHLKNWHIFNDVTDTFAFVVANRSISVINDNGDQFVADVFETVKGPPICEVALRFLTKLDDPLSHYVQML